MAIWRFNYAVLSRNWILTDLQVFCANFWGEKVRLCYFSRFLQVWAGLNSLVSVAGSSTLLRMHFAEFLKLLDIFALFNFYNFSSRGQFTNALFNFYILHSAKKIKTQKNSKQKTAQMQDWYRGRQLSGFQFGKSDFKSNQFAQHFFRITPNQFYFWETL